MDAKDVTVSQSLESALQGWLPQQRWYADKGRVVAVTSVISDVTLVEGVRHLLVEVSFTDGGEPHTYQVPIAEHAHPVDGHDAYLLGQVGDRLVYDALHDNKGTDALLLLLAEGGAAGGLRFSVGTEKPIAGLPGLALAREQSNSSVVYGGEAILKVFRRVSAGVNPDVELTRALAEAGSAAVPEPLAWFETDIAGTTTTLGLLQQYFRFGVDGWRLAVASVRDLYAEADLHAGEVGGDFAGEAHRLGVTTAEVHMLLRESLPSRPEVPDEWAQVSVGMLARLSEAVAAVPQLAPHEPGLREAYIDLADLARPGATGGAGGAGGVPVVQRIHGDYHLGQVLRTEAGWVLLDFEGEPARPLEERTALMSPLRDVAGMLRSFDYAARVLLTDHPDAHSLEYRADEWAERNRTAFCEGYARGGGGDPREQSVLMRAFELDKAVYEVVYEARNRPGWLPIPLGSIQRLVR